MFVQQASKKVTVRRMSVMSCSGSVSIKIMGKKLKFNR